MERVTMISNYRWCNGLWHNLTDPGSSAVTKVMDGKDAD